MNSRKPVISILAGKALKIFSDNDPLRLAGATAFFTTFALPAVLFLILEILNVFLPAGESREQLFDKLNNYVGTNAARHLFRVIRGFNDVASEPLAMIAGFVFLLFVATTLFKVIKNSLNDLWDIRVVQKKSAKLIITTRGRELIVILSAGLLLLLALFLDGVQMTAGKEFPAASEFFGTFMGNAIGFLISVAVATCWFGIIFCFLPDARMPLRIGFAGALLTSILFNCGKILLRYLLFHSNINSVFGASASVVLLLLFVFYSSFIFYFGAAFTRVLANHYHEEVKPLPHAAHYVVKASKND